MKQPNNPILLLLLVCIGLFFVNLDVWYVNIMEARNFISAREILTENNWLLPTLNGQPRYQKPPLPTWLTAISGLLFGLKSLTAMRLPAAIMATLLVLTGYRFGTKLTQNKVFGITAALVMGTSFLIVFAGRNGQWDIFTYTFMLVAIYQLFQYFSKKTHRLKHAIFAGIFIGLSGMSKGPVAMYSLLVPFLIAYGVVYQYKNLSKRWLGILIFVFIGFLLAGWWYYYALITDPEPFIAITKKETFNWTHKNIKPFYYYWSFFLQSGIWALLALIGLLYPYLKNKVEDRKGYAFTLLWTLISVVLLSIIPEKKSRYLLPVLIPLALNTSFYLIYLFKDFKNFNSKYEQLPVYVNFGFIALLGISFPIVGYLYIEDALGRNWIWYILLSLCLVAIGLFMAKALRRKNIQNVFYGSISFVCAIILFGMPLSKVAFKNPAYKPLSQVIAWQTQTQNNVYEYSVISVEMVWDYGKKLAVIKRDNEITIPEENSFGVLVSQEQHQAFLETFKEYSVEKIVRYDMNTAPVGNKSYRTRLWRDLYLVRLKKSN